MRNFVIIGFLSLFFSFHLLAGQDSYQVKTENYELRIEKVSPLISLRVQNDSDNSLVMTAKADKIISYLHEGEITFEAGFNLSYKISVESSIAIDDIKAEVLHHFLKATNLELISRQYEQNNLSLSYHSDLEMKETEMESDNSSSKRLILQLDRRLIMRGLSLESCVKTLNESICTSVFEVGDTNVDTLPKLHLLKRKLTDNPISYLESKGFEIEEVTRVIDASGIIDSE